jgi:hypothetical protein
MFQIETAAKARLEDIEVLSQKNRKPDEGVGVKLTLQVKLINGVLGYFNGRLKSFLFEKGAAKDDINKQEQLPGTETTDMRKLSDIGAKVKTLKWSEEITALEIVIDRGLGGDSNIILDDCTVSNIKISPQEGGTVVLKFWLEAQNVPAKIFGDLALFKSREIEITMIQHEPKQEDIETQPQRGANGGKPAAKAAAKALEDKAPTKRAKEWPFGADGQENTPAPGSAEAAFLASQAKGPPQ